MILFWIFVALIFFLAVAYDIYDGGKMRCDQYKGRVNLPGAIGCHPVGGNVAKTDI